MTQKFLPQLISVRGARAANSFRYFFEHFAWPVLQPGTVFKPNWHIDAICEHMEALRDGKIRKLLVNMPFRMLKSTIISQAFNAWDWIDNPSREFLTASYSRDLATRDAVEARRVIESAAYQIAFGHKFRLVTDQNVKQRYENSKRGKRIITSTDSTGTGFGGDIRIIDDPVSAKEADSPTAIAASVEWWKGTMATRANDLGNVRVCVVHQRLNAEDLTGYLLAHEKGWEHLVLPFRYDAALTKTTSLGFVDPRTEDGELIHAERVPEEAAKDLESTLGSYHVSAQLQQNPEPRGGVIFMRKDWRYWKATPTFDEVVISVDCTFKDTKKSDHVAIQAWGNVDADSWLLPGRIKERMGFAATVQAIRNMKALYPDAIAVLIEDKANGSAVIETLKSEIEGVIAIEPEGGKYARAMAVQPAHEAGNYYIPDIEVESNIEIFVGTCSKFTGAEGGDDDEVDSFTQYANWRRARNGSDGLQRYMKALATKAAQDAEALKAQA